MEGDLRLYIAKLVEAAESKGYDGKVEGWSYQWTFPNVLLFTITIMTTIGYGHICPQTDDGKLFTIIYALVLPPPSSPAGRDAPVHGDHREGGGGYGRGTYPRLQPPLLRVGPEDRPAAHLGAGGAGCAGPLRSDVQA